jgi:tetratricopeptide (TPR) repeat protein
MAKLCVFRGQRARALELYERAAELAPEDPVLANLKASLQPAAEMACHATCETDAVEPEQQEPVFATATVAELCLRQGHLEKAHAIYQNLHQANPADEAIRERLAHVASLLGAEALDTAAESTSHSAGTESSASDDDAPHAVVATLQKWLLAIKARREHVQKHSAGHC